VRIAFSGSHGSGKSTLLAQVADLLPHFATVDEPYHLLEEEGYESAEEPSIEDFEAQLEKSLSALEALTAGTTNVLFDRCPADILAYLLAHEESASFDADEWLERVRDAMEMLDLIVFVPIERPDRIVLPAHDNRVYRMAVHEKLEELLLENPLAPEVDVLTVEGDMRRRVQMVMSRVEAATGAR
jgi:predicted ATPase